MTTQPTTGRCKDCRYWQITDRHWTKVEKNTCRAPAMLFGYGFEPHEVPDDGVLIEDDEGWGWLTGPDFGCVHWESKP